MDRDKRSQVKWGIILIGLGIIFLLNTLGVIRHFNWRLLVDFWPVIIIIVGLNIILKNTPLWWLTPIIVVLGIIALFFINGGSGFYRYDYDYNYSSPFSDNNSNIYRDEHEIEQDIEMMDIELSLSAGRLVLDSVRDKKNLYEARLKTRKNDPYFNYTYKEDEKTGYLTIKQVKGDNKWFNISGKNDWKLYLPTNIPLKLSVNAGAGEFNFNIEELQIEELLINSGAGDLEIDLGDYAQYIKLNAAAANVELNIPDNKAVSIKTAGLISNNNFTKEGLIKRDNLYQSPNYQNSKNKLEIEINSPASNLELKFYRVD